MAAFALFVAAMERWPDGSSRWPDGVPGLLAREHMYNSMVNGLWSRRSGFQPLYEIDTPERSYSDRMREYIGVQKEDPDYLTEMQSHLQLWYLPYRLILENYRMAGLTIR